MAFQAPRTTFRALEPIATTPLRLLRTLLHRQNYYAAHEGVFVNEVVNTVGGITDGMSNTIFFGEYTGGTNDVFFNGAGTTAPANALVGTREIYLAWMGADGMPTKWSVNNGVPVGNTPFAMSSYHTGIINVAFGDGSVHAISNNMPPPVNVTDWAANGTDPAWEALQALAGKSDGDLVNTSVIGF